MKLIGPAFASELGAAGLLGLPFAWGNDGQIQFNSAMTKDQVDRVLAVYDAHDPFTPLPNIMNPARVAIDRAATFSELKDAIKLALRL